MSAEVEKLVAKYSAEFPDAPVDHITAMIGAYFDGKLEGIREAKNNAVKIIKDEKDGEDGKCT